VLARETSREDTTVELRLANVAEGRSRTVRLEELAQSSTCSFKARDGM